MYTVLMLFEIECVKAAVSKGTSMMHFWHAAARDVFVLRIDFKTTCLTGQAAICIIHRKSVSVNMKMNQYLFLNLFYSLFCVARSRVVIYYLKYNL